MKRRKLDATKFSTLLDEVESTEGSTAPEVDGGAIPASGSVDGGTDAVRPASASPPANEELQKLVDIDVLSIELGYSLLRLADEGKGGDLIDRITGLRKSFAREMGLVLPTVAVRDNFELEANDYRFLLRGKPVAEGRLLPNRSLAMNVW